MGSDYNNSNIEVFFMIIKLFDVFSNGFRWKFYVTIIYDNYISLNEENLDSCLLLTYLIIIVKKSLFWEVVKQVFIDFTMQSKY